MLKPPERSHCRRVNHHQVLGRELMEADGRPKLRPCTASERNQPANSGPHCLQLDRFHSDRDWLCLSSLQWFSQHKSQLTNVWFTSTGSHKLLLKGPLYHMTKEPTTSPTSQKLSLTGLRKMQVRYQLRCKNSARTGHYVSECGTLFFKIYLFLIEG